MQVTDLRSHFENATSVIPLANGSKALRADLITQSDGVVRGVVLAVTESDFVTWEAWLRPGETQFITLTGDYFHTDYGAAEADFDDRRQRLSSTPWRKQ